MSNTIKINNIKELRFKIISAILCGISWIVVIGMGIADKSIKIPLYISLFFSFIFVLSVFGKQIYSIFSSKEDNKTPEPISIEAIEKLEKLELIKMGVYQKKGCASSRYTRNINGNVIYARELILHRDIEMGERTTNRIWIVINATYPQLIPTISDYYITYREVLDKIMNDISRTPSNPNVEKSRTGVDNFGRPIIETEKISYDNKEKKEDAVV